MGLRCLLTVFILSFAYFGFGCDDDVAPTKMIRATVTASVKVTGMAIGNWQACRGKKDEVS